MMRKRKPASTNAPVISSKRPEALTAASPPSHDCRGKTTMRPAGAGGSPRRRAHFRPTRRFRANDAPSKAVPPRTDCPPLRSRAVERSDRRECWWRWCSWKPTLAACGNLSRRTQGTLGASEFFYHSSPTLHLLHFLPLPALRRREHRVGDVVGGQAVLEIRFGRFAVREALEKVRDLVDEAVFVTDLQAGHPPVFHVVLVAVVHVDVAPAADAAFVAMIEILEAMKV